MASGKLAARVTALLGKNVKSYRAGSTMAEVVRNAGIPMTADFERIVRLPRRDWKMLLADNYVEYLSNFCLKPGGQGRLFDEQAAVLTEFVDYGGFLGNIGLGCGKTLVTALAPTLIGAERPVLMAPANLREKTARDFKALRKNWLVHPRIEFVSYEMISRNPEILFDLDPDCLMGDEVHALRNLRAACTKRVQRFRRAKPRVPFLGVSGTLTSRSLRDIWHLMMWALHPGRMPLPQHHGELENWCSAIDEKVDSRMHPGVLLDILAADLALTAEEEKGLQGEVDSLLLSADRVERELSRQKMTALARKGLKRRFEETAGYMASSGMSCGASISIEKVTPPRSPLIEAAIDALRGSGEDEHGVALLRPADIWAKARQYSCGFVYRWEPPPPEEWRIARRHKDRLIRYCLSAYSGSYDSPLQIENAIRSGHIDQPFDVADEDQKPDLRLPLTILAAWKHEAPLYKYEVIPEWVDLSRMQWISNTMLTARDADPVIVWVEHVAVGQKLAEISGRRFYHEGGLSADKHYIEDAREPCIASVASNHKGRNLQFFSKNFIVSAPPVGLIWEQCLDSSTEILTEDGWCSIDHPAWGKAALRVAAFDKATGEITWEQGRRMERLLGEEKMFGISNPHLDVRVTAGHRMVHHGIRRFGDGGKDGFEYRPAAFVEASKLPARGRIPVAGDQKAKGVPLTKEELIFLGLFMSDGNLSPGNNSISIFQSDRYPEIVELCENTLTMCGFRFRHSRHNRPTNFGERNHVLNRWAISYGKPKKGAVGRGWSALEPFVGKHLPAALDDMTAEQLQYLLYGLWAGDGNKTKGTYPYDRYVAGTMTIASNPKAAERIQALCVRRGMRCNLVRVSEHMSTLHISHDRTWSLVNMSVSDGRPRWSEQPSDPSERVWCVEVPSGAIVTRRNGKVAIVGNCLGRTHRTGQRADHVEVYVLEACHEHAEGFAQVLRDCRYVYETQGTKQRMLSADVL